MSAEFDRARSHGGLRIETGLAPGPFFGGLLIGDGAHALLVTASVLLLLISTFAMLAPAALLDGERTAASTEA